MTIMLDYLNAEIDKRKNDIAEIERERERIERELGQRQHELRIELRAYEDIRERFRLGDAPVTAGRGGRSATPIGTLMVTPGVTRTKLAEHWKVVLREAVERHPAMLKIREVPTIQRAAGYEPSPRTNTRTHFHKLRQEGLYERADLGAVRATKAAAELLGVPLGRGSDPTQETEVPNGGTLFGTADRETAGQAHEANPAASFHHNQGGPNGTALAK
jgi:hypothetical protein